MNAESKVDSLELTVMRACRLTAANGSVTRVTVVGNRRLTYDEMVRCRDQAAACEAEVAMDAQGTVSIRPRKETSAITASPRDSGIARRCRRSAWRLLRQWRADALTAQKGTQ